MFFDPHRIKDLTSENGVEFVQTALVCREHILLGLYKNQWVLPGGKLTGTVSEACNQQFQYGTGIEIKDIIGEVYYQRWTSNRNLQTYEMRKNQSVVIRFVAVPERPESKLPEKSPLSEVQWFPILDIIRNANLYFDKENKMIFRKFSGHNLMPSTAISLSQLRNFMTKKHPDLWKGKPKKNTLKKNYRYFAGHGPNGPILSVITDQSVKLEVDRVIREGGFGFSEYLSFFKVHNSQKYSGLNIQNMMGQKFNRPDPRFVYCSYRDGPFVPMKFW